MGSRLSTRLGAATAWPGFCPRFIRGVLRAAKATGRRVPGELLIAAGVDSIQAREGDPPVTALTGAHRGGLISYGTGAR